VYVDVYGDVYVYGNSNDLTAVDEDVDVYVDGNGNERKKPRRIFSAAAPFLFPYTYTSP